MADNVQWIKFKVGMFDGESFKRIKRAKIGGVTYRDKLTAVWFELMDLAGKSNRGGYLIDANDLPYKTYDDIAVMLDREEKEIELCMQFFINENMVEIVDDIYCLTNFLKYQSLEGLEKIREQNRVRKAKWKEKQLSLIGNVTESVTEALPKRDSSISISNSYINKKKEKGGMGEKENKIPPDLGDVTAYCKERKNGIDPEEFIDFYQARGWFAGKTKMKDWRAAVRTWEKNRKSSNKQSNSQGGGVLEQMQRVVKKLEESEDGGTDLFKT